MYGQVRGWPLRLFPQIPPDLDETTLMATCTLQDIHIELKERAATYPEALLMNAYSTLPNMLPDPTSSNPIARYSWAPDGLDRKWTALFSSAACSNPQPVNNFPTPLR